MRVDALCGALCHQTDQKGLQGEWVAWLQSAARIYPQLVVPAVSADQAP